MTIAEGDPRPSRVEERWFGGIVLAVFCVLGLLLGWQLDSSVVTRNMVGTGIAVAILYYTIGPLRTPLFRSWMALTMPVGRILSTAILAVIYFLALTPLAWWMRIFRRDYLKQRSDPTANTYWIAYDPGADEDRYFRQS